MYVFDHYLKMAFSMASDDHVHFSPINKRSPMRFIGENLEPVRSAARLVASKAAAAAHRRIDGRIKPQKSVERVRRGDTSSEDRREGIELGRRRRYRCVPYQ